MSEKKDRFKRVDSAVNRVRTELDEAVDESKETGGKAVTEVREAIDELEAKVDKLRKKKKKAE